MLTQTKQTLACANCSQVFRVENIGPMPQPPALCPACGSRAIEVYKDTAMDYFEGMSKLYNLPTFVIKMLYEHWNPKEVPSFKDFLNSMDDGNTNT